MESPARPTGPRSGTAGTITVAELIARCSGAPEPVVRPPDPALADAVSVAALQRREGRGRHIADRPLQPRGHSRRPGPRPRHSIRKATAAASALFAVGAVLGSAVVDTAARDRAGPEPGIGLAQPTGEDTAGGSTAGAGTAGGGTAGGGPAGGGPAGGGPAGGAAAGVDVDRDDVTLASMRMLFADGPSYEASGAFADLAMTPAPEPGGERSPTGTQRPSTPGEAEDGPDAPAASTSSPGTIPSGGAGTPPDGIRSSPTQLVLPPLDAASGSAGPGSAPSLPRIEPPEVEVDPAEVAAPGIDIPAAEPVKTPAGNDEGRATDDDPVADTVESLASTATDTVRDLRSGLLEGSRDDAGTDRSDAGFTTRRSDEARTEDGDGDDELGGLLGSIGAGTGDTGREDDAEDRDKSGERDDSDSNDDSNDDSDSDSSDSSDSDSDSDSNDENDFGGGLGELLGGS